jgi:hypothetical protein
MMSVFTGLQAPAGIVAMSGYRQNGHDSLKLRENALKRGHFLYKSSGFDQIEEISFTDCCMMGQPSR